MSDKKTSNIFKIAVGVLLLLLIGAIFFGVSNYSKLEETKAAFEVEKSIKIEELKSLQTQYDNLIAEDAANKDEILAANERISKLLDSVGKLEADVAVIDKLRKSKAYYQGQLKKLKEENEILKQENAFLNIQKDSLSTELESSFALNDSISKSNLQLQEVVMKAQKIQISNLKPSAKRIKGSDKVVEVTKAKRTTGIEVCYDVAPNSVAEKGDKEFYIQVLDPTKKVIGGQYSFDTEDGQKIIFSKVSKFRYNNEPMKICDFVEPLDSETFMAGTYIINVFNGTTLVQKSKVSLK